VRLNGRLEARSPLPDALRRLAADLDDPSADLVVAALVLNAELRGPGLRASLTALAASAREELDMRRRVEAGRRGIRRGVGIVVAVTAGFLGVLVLFNRDYLAPYDDPLGQVVLAGVCAVFACGFAMLRHLAAFELPDRFLEMPDDGAHAARHPGLNGGWAR
jgi:Flp pilus assembly protein TadB